MPKQIWKIDQFHGGQNDHADPRDIADNELAQARDIMVDRMGVIRLMGASAVHGEVPANTALPHPADNPGHGLFVFSHDRINGHIGNAEHLDNTGDFSSNWDNNGDFAVDSTDATYTHSSGSGNIIQTAANRLQEGIANVTYSFTYTISGFSETITLFRISGSGDQFASANTDLEQSNGTHTTTFTSHATDPDQPFTIIATSGSSGAFNIDNVSLKLTSVAETGDDYLVMADTTNANLDIYSKGKDVWSTDRIDLGSTANMVATFYTADGVLRVSDAAFGAANETKWYGYIYRYFLGDGNSGYTATGHTNGILKDTWHVDEAAPKALPVHSIRGVPPSAITQTPTDNYPIAIRLSGVSASAYHNGSTAALEGAHKIQSAVVNWAATSNTLTNAASYSGYDKFCTVGDKILITKASEVDNDRIFTVLSSATNTILVDENTDDSDSSDTVDMHNLTRSGWVTDVPELGTSGIPNHGWEFAVSTLYDDNKQESALYKFEMTGLHDAGADSNTVMTDANTKSNGDASFIVDGLIGYVIKNLTDGSEGRIIDNDANTITVGELLGGDDNSWDEGDSYSISIMSPYAVCGASRGLEYIGIAVQVFAGDGVNDGFSVTHPRVSGFKIYMRHEGTTTWYQQGVIDIAKGFKFGDVGGYKMWGIGGQFTGVECASAFGGWRTDIKQLETYESNTGVNPDYSSVGFDGVGTGFKTAVIANRMAYVGNVRMEDKEGNIATHGDAVLKSHVNKFDSFTLDRIIETSINDGDEIVKLEEYADRLLVFKKKKMQLVNISQEIEFLEDTFMHKGVIHPAATCKTDFGIAWVNNTGVYLYDGQKVNNLFEKQGRTVVSSSVWKAWTLGELPIIGYFPEKRHLIIRQDSGSGNNDGDVYVFDMVTQSWTIGIDRLPSDDQSSQVTNFVNDWNGDLVLSENGSYGGTTSTVVKWVDNSEDATQSYSTDVRILFKDIDFGHPGVRKKVYRVNISYKGDADGLTVEYGVNGDNPTGTTYYFEGTNSDGTPTGSSEQYPLLDKSDLTQWHHAELKPDTPSEANNIYSFQLYMYGTADNDFEINDVSIVYRLKNIK